MKCLLRNKLLQFSFISLSLIANDNYYQDNCKYLQSNIGIDFNYSRFRLGEIPTISGYLAGVHFDIYYKKPKSVLIGAYFNGRWNAGHLCSENDLCNPSDIRSKIRDYITSVHLGYTVAICDEKFLFTPLVGVGFYHLSNTLRPDIIRYKYFNVYVPIGFELQWNKDACLSIGLNTRYRADAYTRLKLTTPCVTICDKLKLKRSHGVTVELPITWKRYSCERFDIQFKWIPFFDWNVFGATCEVTSDCISLEVPKLKRWYLGTSTVIGFTF